ncbi:hypothetical protein AGABI1DRAFT_70875 [Agaricus bisporus var. burnettii JB137-S8]|uniref:Alpha/beta hydrolase fold-3 domain-containing protein n=1 Tax=Agaricus bisporus var. burnettii (strain JB137-S8 / ATCC MYA-4627 / FGSC 10392) TaxID=597362 RepID=K5W5X0_AGABU|nr:uncharacterized protein AGABI1DRAFT_70875 [Agaricus bisporus var. burnettii JB137-S8]EKM82224.1 hypothetical protein AGABI1DRAFT_70875 [Agaricus bisporus var. burnettii JB137-S8]
MPSPDYAQVTLWEKILLICVLCSWPIAMTLRLLLSPFRSYDRHRSWRRIVSDESFRFISSRLRVNQMQYIMVSTISVYLEWVQKYSEKTLLDYLDEDGNLMWFTERDTTGKVVFYVHGGTYQLPMQKYVPDYWITVLGEMKERIGEEFDLVALCYSLYPSSSFPIQLRQAISGLAHLINVNGIKPEDIYLVGDSAGGGLILQVISHLLHPYQDIPVVQLSAPLGGAFLMSPWVSLTTESLSYTANSGSDVLPAETWAYLASAILKELPDDGRPYLEAVKAPKDWWKGVDRLVKKFTILTGAMECLRDDNMNLAAALERHHKDVTLFVQPDGVHTEPYLARMAGDDDQPEILDLIEKHFT